MSPPTRSWLVAKIAAFLSAGLSVILIAASVGVVYRRLYGAPNDPHFGSYPIWDWLTNYGQGFVRRGLGGELINRVRGTVPLMQAINTVVFCQYAVLCALLAFILLVSPGSFGVMRFLVIAAPGGILAMAVDNVFYYRKEVLFEVFTAFAALLYMASVRIPEPWSICRKTLLTALLTFISVVSVVLPFVHEDYLFLSAPAMLILLRLTVRDLRPEGSRSILGATWAFICVQIILFGLFVWFRGGSEMASHMESGIALADPVLYGKLHNAATMPIAWSISRLLSVPAFSFYSGDAWLWLVPSGGTLLCVGTTAALSLGKSGKGPEHLSQALVTYAFLLAGSVPLYFLGVDWGRWVSSTAISFFIIFLCTGTASLFPGEGSPPEAIRTFARWIFGRRYVLAAVLLCFEATYHMPNVPHGFSKGEGESLPRKMLLQLAGRL